MSAAPVTPFRTRRSLWRRLFGIAAALALLVAVGVFNVLTLSIEAAGLRRSLLGTLEGRATTEVQVSAGPCLLAALRTTVAHIPDVPPHAREVLHAVRKVSVGVYRLASRGNASERHQMMTAAEQRMQERGWVPLVLVSNDSDLVMIYAPRDSEFAARQSVCVVVCSAERLVVAAGVLDVRALMNHSRLEPGLARL